MLHLLFDGRPWFRPKRYGFGTGLPVVWQGWLLMAAHVALVAGLAVLLDGYPVLQFAAVLLAAFAPLPIYAHKTRGGWSWRWGNKETKE